MIPPPSSEYLAAINTTAPEMKTIALAVRTTVLELALGAFEIPFDYPKAVAMAFSFTGRQQQAFIHTIVHKNWVSLSFNRGIDLHDPAKVLRGDAAFIRYIRISSIADLERHYVGLLIKEAARLAPRPATVILKEPKPAETPKPKRKYPANRKRSKGGARGNRGADSTPV